MLHPVFPYRLMPRRFDPQAWLLEHIQPLVPADDVDYWRWGGWVAEYLELDLITGALTYDAWPPTKERRELQDIQHVTPTIEELFPGLQAGFREYLDERWSTLVDCCCYAVVKLTAGCVPADKVILDPSWQRFILKRAGEGSRFLGVELVFTNAVCPMALSPKEFGRWEAIPCKE